MRGSDSIECRTYVCLSNIISGCLNWEWRQGKNVDNAEKFIVRYWRRKMQQQISNNVCSWLNNVHSSLKCFHLDSDQKNVIFASWENRRIFIFFHDFYDGKQMHAAKIVQHNWKFQCLGQKVTHLMQMLLFSVPNDSICLFLLWPLCFFATALLDAFVFGFIFMSCDSGRVRHVFICVNLCENIREFGFEI